MANKLQGTYPLATTLSPTARILLIDGGATKEIIPADLAAALGVTAGGVGGVPVNSVLPLITGTAQVAQTLTCSQGTWSGGAPNSYAFQWKSNNVNVGSNQPTYLLVSGDLGHTITCTVTATNGAGSASATSNPSSVVIAASGSAPVNTVLPIISGNTSEGQTLDVTTGGWNNSPTSFAYQWRANNVNVSGATQNTYVIQTSDVGKTITCAVTATNANGSVTVVSAATATITGLAVVAFNAANKSTNITLQFGDRAAVKTSGTDGGNDVAKVTTGYSSSKRYFEIYKQVQYLGVDFQIGLAVGTASNSAALGTAFGDSIILGESGWEFNGIVRSAPLANFSSGSDLICFAVDLDAKLIWARADNGLWNDSATANPTTGVGGISYTTAGLMFPAVNLRFINSNLISCLSTAEIGYPVPAGFQPWNSGVQIQPVNTALPVITGTPQVGSTLTCSTGTWSNTPTSYAYQWSVNGQPVGTNSPTYVPVSGDQSFAARCTVTAANGGGSASAQSAVTTAIQPAPPIPVNTAVPTISGLPAQEGTLLTCSNGTWTNSPTSYTFQWQLAGSDITGANQNTYTPVTGDIGSPLRCVVRAINGGGTSAPANTAATANVTAIAPVAPVNTFAPAVLGVAQVGQPLFVTQGAWNQHANAAPTSYSYQWQKGASTNIGTNSNTYTPVVGDLAAAVKCIVSAINATGTTTATAPAVGTVAAAIAAATVTVDLVGASPSAATLLSSFGLTFARSTTALYKDSGGVVQSAAINAPRYETDERTGEKGLLIEDARTNYVFPSIPNVTGGRWVVGAGSTLTPNNQASPAGTTTASRIVLAQGQTGSSVGVVYQPTMTYPTDGVRSDWVKGTAGQSVYCFNQQTGGVTARIKHTFSGAWERTAPMQVTSPTGAWGFATVATHGLVTDAADGLPAVTFDVWHCQTEDGSQPTSSIPTTTAAVTRAADLFSVTANPSLAVMKTASATANTGGGCFMFTGLSNFQAESAEWALIGSTTDGGWGMNGTAAGPNIKGTLANVAYIADAGLGWGNRVPQRVIGRWQRSNYYVCVDGFEETASDPVTTIPVVSGNVWNVGAGFNGLIQKLEFWNVPLTNVEMQKLSKAPPYVMASATPRGASVLGYTSQAFDYFPTAETLAPGLTGNNYSMFIGLYYQSADPANPSYYAPDKTGWNDTANGLTVPFNQNCTSEMRNSWKGKLPFLGGIDGFYIEFEWMLSNDHWSNFPGLWCMPQQHNTPTPTAIDFDDVYYLQGGEGTNFERWMELDVHEQLPQSRNSSNSVGNWYGIYDQGGYTVDWTNNASMIGYLDQRVPHVIGASYDPLKNECRWYLDNRLCAIAYGNGSRSWVGGSANAWLGDNISPVAKQQDFYFIFDTATSDASWPYEMYVKRVRAYQPTTLKNKKIVGFGDSLTYGTGASGFDKAWLFQLATAINRIGVDLGQGGQPSNWVADAVVYNVGKYNPALDIITFEGGFNNFQNAGYVEADYARMVSAINALGGSPKWVILGIPTGTYHDPNDTANPSSVDWLWAGHGGRAMIDTINSNLAATYGTRFIDINAYLIANGSTHSGQDATDDTHSIVPTSCRADAIHWNDKGQLLVAQAVQARLVSLGWA